VACEQECIKEGRFTPWPELPLAEVALSARPAIADLPDDDCGFKRVGFLLGPAVGALLAERIATGAAPAALTPCSCARFST
jgi:glycine/D-amino acid oxidase-like deaminating enzyme